jgi:hypothetical protein
MAFTFNGTNNYLSSSPPVVAMPLTMVCWFKLAQVTLGKAIMSISTAGGSGRFQMSHTSGTFSAFISDGLSSVGAANVCLGLSCGFSKPAVGTWHHGACVFASTTSRTAYLNAADYFATVAEGGSEVSGTSTVFNSGPSAPDRLLIGARIDAGAIGAICNGDIAEVAIYNVALTRAEIVALAKGFTPDQVRPQSLVFYAPLVRNLIDTKGGLPITNNNSATVVEHPRIII